MPRVLILEHNKLETNSSPESCCTRGTRGTMWIMGRACPHAELWEMICSFRVNMKQQEMWGVVFLTWFSNPGEKQLQQLNAINEYLQCMPACKFKSSKHSSESRSLSELYNLRKISSVLVLNSMEEISMLIRKIWKSPQEERHRRDPGPAIVTICTEKTKSQNMHREKCLFLSPKYYFYYLGKFYKKLSSYCVYFRTVSNFVYSLWYINVIQTTK